jgi:hypothetical protein
MMASEYTRLAGVELWSLLVFMTTCMTTSSDRGKGSITNRDYKTQSKSSSKNCSPLFRDAYHLSITAILSPYLVVTKGFRFARMKRFAHALRDANAIVNQK